MVELIKPDRDEYDIYSCYGSETSGFLALCGIAATAGAVAASTGSGAAQMAGWGLMACAGIGAFAVAVGWKR